MNAQAGPLPGLYATRNGRLKAGVRVFHMSWCKPVQVAFCLLIATVVPVYAEVFTITEAIRMAVQTNPAVGESSANKRATEAELNQQKGALLPQVRLEV